MAQGLAGSRHRAGKGLWGKQQSILQVSRLHAEGRRNGAGAHRRTGGRPPRATASATAEPLAMAPIKAFWGERTVRPPPRMNSYRPPPMFSTDHVFNPNEVHVEGPCWASPRCCGDLMHPFDPMEAADSRQWSCRSQFRQAQTRPQTQRAKAMVPTASTGGGGPADVTEAWTGKPGGSSREEKARSRTRRQE